MHSWETLVPLSLELTEMGCFSELLCFNVCCDWATLDDQYGPLCAFLQLSSGLNFPRCLCFIERRSFIRWPVFAPTSAHNPLCGDIWRLAAVCVHYREQLFAEQVVNPLEANRHFVILGYINKTDFLWLLGCVESVLKLWFSCVVAAYVLPEHFVVHKSWQVRKMIERSDSINPLSCREPPRLGRAEIWLVWLKLRWDVCWHYVQTHPHPQLMCVRYLNPPPSAGALFVCVCHFRGVTGNVLYISTSAQSEMTSHLWGGKQRQCQR